MLNHSKAFLERRLATRGLNVRLLASSLLLAAAVAAVYWPVVGYPFVNYDDGLYVYDNPHVLGGLSWENVRWAFDGFHANFWHPLVWLSLTLDATLFGRGAAGFHVTNVVLHFANALLLWRVLAALTGAEGRNFAVALLWAIHPLRVESVAWVTERKDTLSGFFWLGTLAVYIAYTRREDRGMYGVLLIVFALGLMAKPILVTLPAVLLVLNVWPLGRWRSWADGWRLILEKAPLALLAAIASGAAYVAQDAGGAVYPLPLWLRACTAVRAAAGYVGKTVWPAGLSVFYPYAKHPTALAVGGALAGLIALTLLAAWEARRRRTWVAVGWAWYGISLLPVCGLVQIGGFAAADRFTYLPSIGLIFAAVWTAAETLPRRWAIAAATVVAVALGVVAARQVTVWRSSQALFGHALEVDPDNWLALYNIGEAKLTAGDIEGAHVNFARTVQLKSDHAEAHGALAYTLSVGGDPYGALEEYLAAARLEPADVKMRFNLAATLVEVGELQSAALAFDCVTRLDPTLTAARERLRQVEGQLRGNGPVPDR